MKCSPSLQWLNSLSFIKVQCMFSISWLAFSTLSWLCKCGGFPWTIFSASQNSFKLVTTLLPKSLPLSNCNIDSAPRDLRITNFVSWSWYTIINLYALSDWDWKLIRFIWQWILNSEKLIGFTMPFLIPLFFLAKFTKVDVQLNETRNVFVFDWKLFQHSITSSMSNRQMSFMT